VWIFVFCTKTLSALCVSSQLDFPLLLWYFIDRKGETNVHVNKGLKITSGSGSFNADKAEVRKPYVIAI